jgi:hypothetical protein
MRIKNVTIKSNAETLSVPNYTVSEFHKLISELNRLNPKALVSITINVGQNQITTNNNNNKKF